MRNNEKGIWRKCDNNTNVTIVSKIDYLHKAQKFQKQLSET